MTDLRPLFDAPGVLIATSNVPFRKQVSRLLEQRRWPMIEALSGADALEKLESSDCRVLVMDDKLPDLHPSELLEMISERFPGVDVLTVDAGTGLPAATQEFKTEAAQ